MALINCPECSNQVSDKAPACPKCGAPIAALVGSAMPATPSPPDDIVTHRRRVYERTLALHTGSRPYSDQEVAVMLSQKKKTSHLLHFVLSIFTFGFWAIMWILIAASNGSVNAKIDKKIAKGKRVQ